MQSMFTLNCKGRLLTIDAPIVMAIINATPDSFFNEGKDSALKDILINAEKMLKDGAAILDIGGMSTRPGAHEVSEEEELNRVIPVIDSVRKNFPDCFISIDTYRNKVAMEAISNGADIINDISAGEAEENILHTAVANRVPYIAMHKQGKPDTMQINPQYDNVTLEVYDFFVKKISLYKSLQLNDIILDVGFGFGKTVTHNYQLLRNLNIFKQLQKPILAGISRKSMICKPLKVNPDKALNGTTALHILALQNGANILRVHDVKEAMECITLYKNYVES